MARILPKIFLVASLFFAQNGGAQDLHFSQFYLHPLHLSPAQTGDFKGFARASAIYRQQWSNVPVNYQTFGAAFDRKLLESPLFDLSGGLLVQRDRAGDGGLSWTQVALSAAAGHALGEAQRLSVGVSVALVQRGFDPANLQFKNQWNGEAFDASRPTRESLETSSGLAPDLAAGLAWRFQKPDEPRTEFALAAGGHHLNGPNVTLSPTDDFKLPLRLSASFSGHYQMQGAFDLAGFAAFQKMTTANEVVFGAGVRYWLSDLVGKKTAVQLTLATRLGDALLPALQLEKDNWTAGLSYDVNTSDFRRATGGHGGLELALVYRWVRVPGVKVFKSCPVF